MPAHSALWLHQGPQRSLRFRAGDGCPPALLGLAAGLFDPAKGDITKRWAVLAHSH